MRVRAPQATLAAVTTSLLWFRRDLRLSDSPALLAARDAADDVLAVFVLDPRLLGPAGAPRTTFLLRCLYDLSDQLDGRLCVVRGDPVQLIPRLAGEHAATSVHVSADFGPYGRERDERVEQALAKDGRELQRDGSPYAVSPGRLGREDGSPYKVFSAFRRAWGRHGWRGPRIDPAHRSPGRNRTRRPGSRLPKEPPLGDDDTATAPVSTPHEFGCGNSCDEAVTAYERRRDLPAADGTSRLSPYLKYGCIHPRTVLHALADGGVGRGGRDVPGRAVLARVLRGRPLAPAGQRPAGPAGTDARHARSTTASSPTSGSRPGPQGRTGYPIVDAGMRQLLADGWMHNRVRMIVASFLVKDLHVDWQRGARYFLQRLVDGDLASNHHGWQWVAGTGTDPAPYFRIFNPTTQGEKFDPSGDYVRRYVPELARHSRQGRAPTVETGAAADRLSGTDRRSRGRAGRGIAQVRTPSAVAFCRGATSGLADRRTPSCPQGADVPALAEAALGCKGCPLHENATQTVFGEGNVRARFVLVGEQPGDVEDRRGRPFVGPAGKLLDRALEEAGLDREQGYVTNAVKHFKFTMARLGQAPHPCQARRVRDGRVPAVARGGAQPDPSPTRDPARRHRCPDAARQRLPGHPLPRPAAARSRGQRSAAAGDDPSQCGAEGRPGGRDEAYAGLVTDLRTASKALASHK